MRAFIACPLPEPVAAALADLAARVKVGRAVPEDNLHLTLAFLDEQPVAVLEALHDELERVRAAPVTLRFHGLEPMSGKRPSVLALRAEGAEVLQKQVMSATRRAGIPLTHRRFRGHVTLARLPRQMTAQDERALGAALSAFGTVDLEPALLDCFALYRSELHPEARATTCWRSTPWGRGGPRNVGEGSEVQNMFGQLFVMSAVAVAGYLTGRLQAYLMIWLFFVPARCKLPLVFNAFRGALPWLAGFLVPIFFVEEGRKYGLETSKAGFSPLRCARF